MNNVDKRLKFKTGVKCLIFFRYIFSPRHGHLFSLSVEISLRMKLNLWWFTMICLTSKVNTSDVISIYSAFYNLSSYNIYTSHIKSTWSCIFPYRGQFIFLLWHFLLHLFVWRFKSRSVHGESAQWNETHLGLFIQHLINTQREAF